MIAGVHDQARLALGVVDHLLAVRLDVVRRAAQEHDVGHVARQTDLAAQNVPRPLEVRVGQMVDDLAVGDVGDVFETALPIGFPVYIIGIIPLSISAIRPLRRYGQ